MENSLTLKEAEFIRKSAMIIDLDLGQLQCLKKHVRNLERYKETLKGDDFMSISFEISRVNRFIENNYIA